MTRILLGMLLACCLYWAGWSGVERAVVASAGAVLGVAEKAMASAGRVARELDR